MESPEVWLQTRQQMPKQDKGIKDLFDLNVIRKSRQVQQDFVR